MVARGNEDGDKKRENKTEGEREGKKEKGSKREKGSASLLLLFLVKLIFMPPEISHCPPSPPLSRLYYTPVQRMNDLHINYEYC